MKIVKQLALLIFIPLVLILFWILGSILTLSNSPLSIIEVSHSASIFTTFKTGEIHKGDVINASFKAKENNLGIVAVRFNTYIRINSDSLVFSIKQKGNKNWYYTGSYKVDQFQPNDFFTFGFPIINNSKDREYVFQLSSVKGKAGDAVALSSIEPVVLSKYQFTKQQLLANKIAIIEFAYKKIFYSFSDFAFAVSSLPFLLPIVFYMLSLWYRRQTLKNKRPLTLIYIFTLILVFCLFLLQLLPGSSTFIFLSSWIFLIILNKLDSSVSFFYALLFLLVTPFMLLLNQQTIAENYAVWTYYFLVIGTAQAIYELKRKPKGQISYTDIISSTIGEDRYDLISSKIRQKV